MPIILSIVVLPYLYTLNYDLSQDILVRRSSQNTGQLGCSSMYMHRSHVRSCVTPTAIINAVIVIKSNMIREYVHH
ncbi:hypothetical protein EV424DRAFT_200449 [Suillus variegatus]|nr:hypothetical protein EV424DRAFT_200449 [Suillus variegatus]